MVNFQMIHCTITHKNVQERQEMGVTLQNLLTESLNCDITQALQ